MPSPSDVMFSSFEANDVDEVQEILARVAVPVSLAAVPGDRPYRCRHEQLRFGPLLVCRSFHSTGLRVLAPDLRSAYAVSFAEAGGIRSQHRGAWVEVSDAAAAVHQPVGEVRSVSGVGLVWYSVMIDRGAVESTLGALLGHMVAGPIRFAPGMDLASPVGRSWARLVRMLAADATDAAGLAARPAVMRPLADAVVRGLLLAADHPDRETLERPAPAYRSGPVRRAVEAIHADPAEPFTLTGLAAIGGVGVRALQRGFHDQLGVSPMGYLRQVRLARAHDELRAADPARTVIAAVAHRWGFTHVGRFAGYYRSVYGCAPSETLDH
ncbi:AraC family transcriptional regulator [Actinoplanes sp. KI2]|uniref:AraC family transcriptional regulator n=1 Tax=Actinoplanes sp. KI2 TaxID=2983315 RepID=UPI0021D5DD6F|nr:AraC family transcriptional regulator [Actinoplanes sp. KI2]MCU7723871.1 AraC family transcriptional regulator [Actinoplanes sp. KI2]